MSIERAVEKVLAMPSAPGHTVWRVQRTLRSGLPLDEGFAERAVAEGCSGQLIVGAARAWFGAQGGVAERLDAAAESVVDTLTRFYAREPPRGSGVYPMLKALAEAAKDGRDLGEVAWDWAGNDSGRVIVATFVDGLADGPLAPYPGRVMTWDGGTELVLETAAGPIQDVKGRAVKVDGLRADLYEGTVRVLRNSLWYDKTSGKWVRNMVTRVLPADEVEWEYFTK